ncbi:thiamine phosphate synthase [Caulobacter sp. NIBR1757]|uniref:thiamine phosphate synthase n=1 Tax=Caulobacter sp. NIBR1757 TaxID=3016000 RepID=UPI0022F06776|nr:thiamine phosphate synthase [Caulobacter sp. NIBR1757]WGM41203.1 Thiamine-phosphate synthase [Caulobacter sp. NIBR1757]
MAQGELARLLEAAKRLRPARVPAKPLPRLLFLTDPDRTPDPEAILETLPPEVGVIYRPFGAANAVEQGRRLTAIARRRGLILLAGADPDLAQAIGAQGVHLPERLAHQLPALRAARPAWILTAAAHSLSAVAVPADALLVSPVFPSSSPSAGQPLGVEAFTALVAAASAPVYALGGVTTQTALLLADSGAAGLAGIDAFLPG